MKFTQTLTTALDWAESNGTVYGIYDGFVFSVVRNAGLGAHVAAWLTETSAVRAKTVRDFVRVNKKKYRLYGKPTLSKNCIIIELNKTFSVAKAEEIVAFLPVFSSFLKENRLKPGCAGCSKEGQFDLYAIEDACICLCDDCAATIGKQKDEIILLSRQGNRVSGVIGALLGGLVGTIPWIILSLLGYIASIGGLAISYASFYGYKIFKGRLDNRAFIIATNMLVVIIMTFVAIILSGCAVFLANAGEAGYDGSLPELLRYAFMLPFDPKLAATAEVWRVVRISYLFSGIGTLIFLLNLGKELKDLQTKVKKLDTHKPDSKG